MSDYRDDFNSTEDDGIEFIDTTDNNEDDGFDSLPREPVKKTTTTRTKEPTFLSEFISYIKIIVVAIIIAFLFTQFIIVNAQVPTGSMKNTIMEGDRLIGFRLSYLFSSPKRGDIVIFKFPDDESENYVKRVIGIPGDVIEIKEGHVYVNGELSSEEYLREDMVDTGTTQTYIVPEDSYFMMGDNRNSSADSRYWKNTYVKRNKILAKVIFRYYDGENKSLNFSFIK